MEEAIELGWSAYTSSDGRGSIFLVPSSGARDVLGVAARETLEIAFDGARNSWFGHEIDIKDADGDGFPDVLVGARMENQQRGGAYYFRGNVLAELYGKGIRRVALSEIDHVRFDPPANAFEFGFSAAIVPPSPNSQGRLVISQQGGISDHAGSVAILPVPRASGASEVPQEAFIWAEKSLDFGRTLLTGLIGSEPVVFVGSYADSGWLGIPYRSGKAWVIRDVASTPKVETIFDTEELSRGYGSASYHITSALVEWASKRYFVFALANIDRSPLAMSGIAIQSEKSDGAFLLLHSAKLPDSALGWSLLSPLDLDGDGFDDLVFGAPYYEGSGALAVLSGADLARAIESPLSEPVRLRMVVPSDKRIATFGSKRRGGCAIKLGGSTRIFAGGPRGGRWDASKRESVTVTDIVPN